VLARVRRLFGAVDVLLSPCSDFVFESRRPASPPDLLTLDGGAIAARIMMTVQPEKGDSIVAALNQRLVLWRVETFDPQRPPVTGGGARR
jgi:hypothetical protein